MRSALVALAALGLAAVPACAQEYAVSRRAYNFFERSLTIEVLADGPGALQVLRGEPGTIEIAGHARDGLAAWALAGYRRDHLRLSALGALHADYVVTVPEDVHVSVALPGERLARSVSRDPVALLRWDGGAPSPQAERSVATGTLPGGRFLVHTAEASPRRVELPDVARLRSVELRVEGDRFLVASSRPMGYTHGRGPLIIRTGGDALDLVITVPRSTRSFRLTGPDGTLAQLDGGRLRAACQPSVQLAVDGLESVLIRPGAGELRCR